MMIFIAWKNEKPAPRELKRESVRKRRRKRKLYQA